VLIGSVLVGTTTNLRTEPEQRPIGKMQDDLDVLARITRGAVVQRAATSKVRPGWFS
jgi:hypothetical protein